MGKDYFTEKILRMPKNVTDLKVFTSHFMSDASKKKTTKKEEEKHRPKNSFALRMVIKYSKRHTKFKLRTKKQLLTYKTDDQKTVKKIIGSLPPHLNRVEIKKKTPLKKKKKKKKKKS